MPEEDHDELIKKQYFDLIASYTGLQLTQSAIDDWRITGSIKFNKSYDSKIINDEYTIEIIIPKEYPQEPPIAKEVGGRIPKDFHTNPNDALCLGAPLAIRMKFAQNPTLYAFVDDSIVPFLYSFSYFEKYGEMPFGELSHGGKGILEYYCDIFQVKNPIIVLRFLKILIDNYYRGHHDCPCGSGLRIRKCHGRKVLEIKEYQNIDAFLYDYKIISIYIVESLKMTIPDDTLPKKLLKSALHKNYWQKLL